MGKAKLLSVPVVGVLGLMLGGVEPAEGQFYKDKTIQIVVGAAPGGAFDLHSRILSRHMGKHIPGNPTIILQNMPGAGTLIAANHVYKVSKPDGLSIRRLQRRGFPPRGPRDKPRDRV
jgi:tripartite-type tricarboxylate transporter receptor subunit TctC